MPNLTIRRPSTPTRRPGDSIPFPGSRQPLSAPRAVPWKPVLVGSDPFPIQQPIENTIAAVESALDRAQRQLNAARDLNLEDDPDRPRAA